MGWLIFINTYIYEEIILQNGRKTNRTSRRKRTIRNIKQILRSFAKLPTGRSAGSLQGCGRGNTPEDHARRHGRLREAAGLVRKGHRRGKGHGPVRKHLQGRLKPRDAENLRRALEPAGRRELCHDPEQDLGGLLLPHARDQPGVRAAAGVLLRREAGKPANENAEDVQGRAGSEPERARVRAGAPGQDGRKVRGWGVLAANRDQKVLLHVENLGLQREARELQEKVRGGVFGEMLRVLRKLVIECFS